MTLYNDKIHCLVVDDDRRLRDLVRRYLSHNDCVIVTAADASEARAMISYFRFDILIVDVMMPGESGFELTADLTARDSTAPPILLLTAKSETEDRISGLESGADDYLTKPFEPRELLLRIEAILRRTRQSESDSALRFGPYRLELDKRVLYQNNQRVDLSRAETDLLLALGKNPGEVIDRDQLSEQLGLNPGSRAIDVQINRLRKKIEPDPQTPRHLITVRGEGYQLHVS